MKHDYLSRFISSLFGIGVFGVFSLSIDLDHIPPLLAAGLPITLHNLSTASSRPLHFLICTLCWICSICYAALFARLLAEMKGE
jgi:hypothetical protein